MVAELHAIPPPTEFIQAQAKSVFPCARCFFPRVPNAVMIYQTSFNINTAASSGEQTKLQWIPGHVDISENTEANKMVREAHHSVPVALTKFARADANIRAKQSCKSITQVYRFGGNCINGLLYREDPHIQFSILMVLTWT